MNKMLNKLKDIIVSDLIYLVTIGGIMTIASYIVMLGIIYFFKIIGYTVDLNTYLNYTIYFVWILLFLNIIGSTGTAFNSRFIWLFILFLGVGSILPNTILIKEIYLGVMLIYFLYYKRYFFIIETNRINENNVIISKEKELEQLKKQKAIVTDNKQLEKELERKKEEEKYKKEMIRKENKIKRYYQVYFENLTGKLKEIEKFFEEEKQREFNDFIVSIRENYNTSIIYNNRLNKNLLIQALKELNK